MNSLQRSCNTLKVCHSTTSDKFNEEISKACIEPLDDIRLLIPKEVHLQDVIWSTESFISVILNCGEKLYQLHTKDIDLNNVPKDSFNVENADFANSWVMCIANLIAGNSTARNSLWKRLGSFNISKILLASPPAIAQKWCAVIQNCLLEDNILKEFSSFKPLFLILHTLCDLYSFESANNCFPLYCLELLLCSPNQINEDCWSSLIIEDRIMCLCALSSILKGEQKRPFQIHKSTIEFVSKVYKNELHQIFSGSTDKSDIFVAEILKECCSCLVTAVIHDQYRAWVQEDTNLLPCVLDFLKIVNAATFTENEGSSAVVWCRKHLCSVNSAKCLRSDLVHILANLIFNSPSNQDQLRLHGGLEEIFSSCRRDENNPLMHEAVGLALSFSVRDNVTNMQHLQKFLSSNEYDKMLEKLNLKPDQYVQIPNSK